MDREAKEEEKKPGVAEAYFLALLKRGDELEGLYGDDGTGVMQYKEDEEGAAADCYWAMDDMMNFIYTYKEGILALLRGIDRS